jgi:hypothetical protein
MMTTLRSSFNILPSALASQFLAERSAGVPIPGAWRAPRLALAGRRSESPAGTSLAAAR